MRMYGTDGWWSLVSLHKVMFLEKQTRHSNRGGRERKTLGYSILHARHLHLQLPAYLLVSSFIPPRPRPPPSLKAMPSPSLHP